jgi:molecular chaperone GrpE
MFRRAPILALARTVVSKTAPQAKGVAAVFRPTLKQFGGVRYFSDSADKAAKSTDADADAASTQASASASAADSSSGASPEAVMQDLTHKNQTLKEEVKAMKDKLLRSYAEEENVRRIAHRDVAAAKEYANMKFAKSLLEVADNLERAIDAITHEQRAEADPHFTTLLQGIEMTQKGLIKVFESHGIVRVRFFFFFNMLQKYIF